MSSFPPESFKPLLERIASLLRSRNEKICVAETAAGGLISASLLSVAGASSFFAGGVTLYTLQSRIQYAGWTEGSVKTYAGPTPEVVKGLAEHVRNDLDADWCLSESGTAGPTRSGEGRNRTPGYVALALAGRQGTVTKEFDTGRGEREANMLEFARLALELLVGVLEEKGKL